MNFLLLALKETVLSIVSTVTLFGYLLPIFGSSPKLISINGL